MDQSDLLVRLGDDLDTSNAEIGNLEKAADPLTECIIPNNFSPRSPSPGKSNLPFSRSNQTCLRPFGYACSHSPQT